jgi:S-DNA-T family DNA segregation ATPase FtsK/SpoIIIE
MYELELAPGTKVGKISSLSDDIAIALKAPSIRVVAPIPGKSTIGIEVPNTHRKPVQMRELYETASKDIHKRTIPLLLGKDIAGYPLIADLAAMPHLLVAGTTGSGKSVCLNSIILSILLFQRPEELKLILIDPKMVEFSAFKDIPHLIAPVVTDMKKAAAILEWAVAKMDERYTLLARAGVRDLAGYNRLSDSEKQRRLDPEGDANLDDIPFYMPCMVIVLDELADLMMVASKEVETSIIRLSQKSRAVGIHLVVATQRPSVDVITGLIKSNLPSRISFHVFSKVDSRTILDQNGAEKLLGKGDMLFLPPGTSKLSRVQGTYVSDEEIDRVVDYLKQISLPEFSPELKVWQGSLKDNDVAKDELYEEAVRIILETQRGSVSLLQRRLEIGYSRAARLIDLMADDGIVGEYKGSQAREVFVTLDEWESQKK